MWFQSSGPPALLVFAASVGEVSEKRGTAPARVTLEAEFLFYVPRLVTCSFMVSASHAPLEKVSPSSGLETCSAVISFRCLWFRHFKPSNL